MRKFHRAVHFDFHNMPGIQDLGRDFDAAAFAQRLADAHVDYINFFAQCNRGYAYYPTKVGIPYPGLQRDIFGEVLRECHARGIGVTAYINIGLMHEQQRRNPHWNHVDKEGRIHRDPEGNPNFFRTLCFNQPEYREYLMATLREICEYDIDGLFCDCTEYFPCHCNHCTADMKALGMDVNDETAVMEFSQIMMRRFFEEIKAFLGPDKYLYLNGMPYYPYRNIHTHVELECLPGGHWGYDYFWRHAAYARNLQKIRVYMTGRFKAGWGDFGGYKGRVSLEHDVYDALCNNFLPSVGDHVHPTQGIIPDIYRDVEAVFARVMEYEKYTDGAEYQADIGVITWSSGYLGDEYAGLARMLGELQLGFDIVHADMDISRFKLVILPEGTFVDTMLKEKLEAFIAAGGKVLSTGTGGLTAPENWPPVVQNRFFTAADFPAPQGGFALEAYDLEYLGADSSNSSYFTFRELPEGTADMPWSMYGEGILMKAKDPSQVRADYVKPYFNKHWDGQHYYYYTPPEVPTGHAVAAVTGSAAHICFNIFTAYNRMAMKEHKLLLKQIIDELLPEPVVSVVSGIPSTARVTLTGKDDYKLLHVKVTFPERRGEFTIAEDHVTLKAGAAVKVRGEYRMVCRLPEQMPVESCIENGYTVVTLPEITGYDMFIFR